MPAIANCVPGLSKKSMTAISAPYNFVPLNRKVHIPEWYRQVSHDWPFKDGLSGVIEYHLIAHSPLLVGGHQTQGSEQAPGEVHPFHLPDGQYAIPGSSLKGLLRSVLEIAGYGRLRQLDEQRPGLRDITGRKVRNSYVDKVRGKVKTGFLRRTPNGGSEIKPCKMKRVSHRVLESDLGVPTPIFRQGDNVRAKYKKWNEICQDRSLSPDQITFDFEDGEAINIGTGEKEGFPVFTGQISDSTQPKGKYKDFIFYDEDLNRSIEVDDAAWRDFLRIHGNDEDNNSTMSWPGYWRARYRRGERVPVFYVQDGDLLRIGLAYMPKLAGDFTTHDLIHHANPAHLESPGMEHGYDLADLLFGAIGENPDDALRARVSLETALAEDNPEPQQQEDTILNGPKPSYFPNYVEQKGVETGKMPVEQDKKGNQIEQYATYMKIPRQKSPVARGFKRYPARPEHMVGVQELSEDQQNNNKVKVRLFPLPAGTRFKGRIQFHNLKPEELGALLWCLTWGGDEGLRHGLGMGKPFGFGQIAFQIDQDNSRLISNDPTAPQAPLDAEQSRRLMEIFTRHMEEVANSLGQQNGWREGSRIKNLLAMADPEAAEELPHGMQLRHMCLQMRGANEFVWAKQEGFVLQEYCEATEWPVPATRARWQTERAGHAQKEIAGSDLSDWLKQRLQWFTEETNGETIEDLMRHGNLFKEWKKIDDADLKKAVFQEIESFWEQQGWWSSDIGSKSQRNLRKKYLREYEKMKKKS